MDERIIKILGALLMAQDDLSAIADGNPDLVDDECLDAIANAIELAIAIRDGE